MPDRYLVIGITAVSVIIVLAYLTIPQTASNGATTDSDTRLLPIVTPFKDKTCTYVIYQDLPIVNNNYTYYANNCSNGSVLSSSMNASKVFNDVSTNCNTNKGCYVHVKGYSNSNAYRAYNITSPILIPQSGHFNFVGEGAEFTVLKIPNGYDNNIFNYTSSSGTPSFFNYFAFFQIWGNRGGTNANHNTGFYFNAPNGGIHDTRIDTIFARDFNQDDIFIGSSADAYNLEVSNSVLEHAGRYALFKVAGSDTKIVHNKFLFNHGTSAVVLQGQYTTLIDNWFDSNDKHGLWLTATANNEVISGNRFAGQGLATVNTYDDILLESTFQNTITGNTFASSTQVKCAIFSNSANNHDNVITGNVFGATYGTGKLCGLTGSTVTYMMGNIQFNPVNKVTNFVDGSTFSPLGSTGTIINGTNYTVDYTNIFITISGGTGVKSNVTDGSGNLIITNSVTLTNQFIPYGYKIKTIWTTIPTVTVWFQ